jgi:cyd operon protein YbgT
LLRFDRLPHDLPQRRDTGRETAMWYFTWILGVGVALGFGIINVMWLEASGKFAREPGVPDEGPPAPPSEASKDTHL